MRPMMLSYIDYLVEEFVEKGITNFQDGFNFSDFDMARRFFGDKINLILPRCVVFVCLRKRSGSLPPVVEISRKVMNIVGVIALNR